MKAYRWLREVHLALGAFAAPYVLLYASSAVLMVHPAFGPSPPVMKTWEATLPVGLSDPAAVHEALRASHDVRGERASSTSADGVLQLRIARPGRRYTIDLDVRTGLASVQEETASALFLLNRLHHASGLSNREPIANAWGSAVVLVSMALLALATTGFWMWLERPKERRLGLLVLCASTTFALTLLLSIRLA